MSSGQIIVPDVQQFDNANSVVLCDELETLPEASENLEQPVDSSGLGLVEFSKPDALTASAATTLSSNYVSAMKIASPNYGHLPSPKDDSMLSAAADINIGAAIRHLVRGESEEFEFVHSEPEQKEFIPIRIPSDANPNPLAPVVEAIQEESTVEAGEEVDNVNNATTTALPIEIEFHFIGKSTIAFPESRGPSEYHLLQQERSEACRKEMLNDSDDSLAEQLAKNKDLLTRLSSQDKVLLDHFTELTDQLLYKIESITNEIQAARDVFQRSVHGKTTGSCPNFDLWNSLLRISIAELKPPSHQKNELYGFVKARLKEIVSQLNSIIGVTSNIALQGRSGVTVISRLMSDWKVKFLKEVWHSVNKKEYRELLAPVPVPPDQDVKSHESTFKRRPSYIPYSENGRDITIHVVWLANVGLVIRNLGSVPVLFPKLNFIDRRTVFNAFVREIMILGKRVLLRVNSVCEQTRFNCKNKPCQLELNMRAIDGILKKKNVIFAYTLEALMVNQLRRIETKFEELVLKCEEVNQLFLEVWKSELKFYRKRIRISKGESKKCTEKMLAVIQELQEVTMNFQIPKRSIDFSVYGNATKYKDRMVIPIVLSEQASIADTVPPSIQNKALEPRVVISESHQWLEPKSLSLCSTTVQNFHTYCSDAIIFFQGGIRNLGTVQYNLFSALPQPYGTNEKEILRVTGWYWILTKSIEQLLNKRGPEDVCLPFIGFFKYLAEYQQIFVELDIFRNKLGDLCKVAEKMSANFEKNLRESRIPLNRTRRTFLSYNVDGLAGATNDNSRINEDDVIIKCTSSQGVRVEFANEAITFNDLGVDLCTKVVNIFFDQVNTLLKQANSVALNIEKLRSPNRKEIAEIFDSDLARMEAFLTRVSDGRFILSLHEESVVAATIQNFMKELSRFQAVVNFLKVKADIACTDLKILEKPCLKLIAGTVSWATARRLRVIMPGVKKASWRPHQGALEALRADLQIIAPIRVIVKDSAEMKKKIKDAISIALEEEILSSLPQDVASPALSIFLRSFLKRTNEIRTLVSTTIVATAQELHLPNSAVEPRIFQVSKIETICALLANGVLGFDAAHPLTQSQYRDLNEQMTNFLKEAELMEEMCNNFLEERNLTSLKPGVDKLTDALGVGEFQEVIIPHLFWSTIVRRKSAQTGQSKDLERSKLTIYWSNREADLDFALPSKGGITSFARLSVEQRMNVLLKLISITTSLCRIAYRNFDDWRIDLQLVDEKLKTLRKDLKFGLEVLSYEEHLYTEAIRQIIHEISVAKVCVENFRTTAKKLSVLIQATLSFQKLLWSGENQSSNSNPRTSEQCEDGFRLSLKQSKSIANIKSAWFTPVKVDVPVYSVKNEALGTTRWKIID